VEAFVLEANLVRRIRRVEPVVVSLDAHSVLLHRTRETARNQYAHHPELGVASTRMEGRSALREELAHHRAPASTTSREIVEDGADTSERSELPPECVVERAPNLVRTATRSEVAERASHGCHRYSATPVYVNSIEDLAVVHDHISQSRATAARRRDLGLRLLPEPGEVPEVRGSEERHDRSRATRQHGRECHLLPRFWRAGNSVHAR